MASREGHCLVQAVGSLHLSEQTTFCPLVFHRTTTTASAFKGAKHRVGLSPLKAAVLVLPGSESRTPRGFGKGGRAPWPGQWGMYQAVKSLKRRGGGQGRPGPVSRPALSCQTHGREREAKARRPIAY